ncbi:MAG: beta-CASP ribonuclease aCPSF1, partial [Candidatus Bathyarchaeia archaeon]
MPSIERSKAEIRQIILEQIPKEVEITRIEFEGPALAIYAKRPEILIEQEHIITKIVAMIKKRIVPRSDPSVRLPEKETERIILEIVPKEAEITNIAFDPPLGEVIIEAKKPGLVIGKGGSILQEITVKTKWRPRVIRSPPKPSKIMTHIQHLLYTSSKEREKFLRNTGERIFR